jgi:hypothetical protein
MPSQSPSVLRMSLTDRTFRNFLNDMHGGIGRDTGNGFPWYRPSFQNVEASLHGVRKDA